MTTSASNPPSLINLDSAALTRRVTALLGDERRCVLAFLWHLAEVDRRALHLELGYPSLFAYCTDTLRLSKAAAWRRTTSARLLVQFPAAADYLADGRLCLSTFVLLKDVLQPENHRDRLDRAAGRSEDEVRLLVATLQPRAEVKDTIRRLPVPARNIVGISLSGSGPELPLDTSPVLESQAAVAPAPRPPRIEPVTAERHSLRMTVGREFLDELEQVKSALSHVVPDGNLEDVLRACFQKTLWACAQRKHPARKAAPRPKAPLMPTSSNPEPTPAPTTSAPPNRQISAAVRRAVWKRDAGSCTFIGTHGRRCGSTWQLEFDHDVPFARGGEATVENVFLRCRAHNQHRARKDFGAAHMARFSRTAPYNRLVQSGRLVNHGGAGWPDAGSQSPSR